MGANGTTRWTSVPALRCTSDAEHQMVLSRGLLGLTLVVVATIVSAKRYRLRVATEACILAKARAGWATSLLCFPAAAMIAKHSLDRKIGQRSLLWQRDIAAYGTFYLDKRAKSASVRRPMRARLLYATSGMRIWLPGWRAARAIAPRTGREHAVGFLTGLLVQKSPFGSNSFRLGAKSCLRSLHANGNEIRAIRGPARV